MIIRARLPANKPQQSACVCCSHGLQTLVATRGFFTWVLSSLGVSPLYGKHLIGWTVSAPTPDDCALPSLLQRACCLLPLTLNTHALADCSHISTLVQLCGCGFTFLTSIQGNISGHENCSPLPSFTFITSTPEGHGLKYHPLALTSHCNPPMFLSRGTPQPYAYLLTLHLLKAHMSTVIICFSPNLSEFLKNIFWRFILFYFIFSYFSRQVVPGFFWGGHQPALKWCENLLLIRNAWS